MKKYILMFCMLVLMLSACGKETAESNGGSNTDKKAPLMQDGKKTGDCTVEETEWITASDGYKEVTMDKYVGEYSACKFMSGLEFHTNVTNLKADKYYITGLIIDVTEDLGTSSREQAEFFYKLEQSGYKLSSLNHGGLSNNEYNDMISETGGSVESYEEFIENFKTTATYYGSMMWYHEEKGHPGLDIEIKPYSAENQTYEITVSFDMKNYEKEIYVEYVDTKERIFLDSAPTTFESSTFFRIYAE